MNCEYIFDVDGTLTPSRGIIDPLFKKQFLTFIENNNVNLISGSDYEKTLEQLGTEICESVDVVYSCAGNSVWEQGSIIYENDWQPDHKLLDFFLTEFKRSNYPGIKHGRHIELRPGFVNFSILGRNQPPAANRMFYKQWDALVTERRNIADRLNRDFPELHASVGGETGIDIHPIGKDKSQILIEFKESDSNQIMFFGDAVEYGGNDYEIAHAVLERPNGIVHKVSSWEDTRDILNQLGYCDF